MLQSIGIQITTRCNLRCRHCFVDLSGKDVALPVLRRTAELARAAGCTGLGLTGGEPSCHPRFPEVVQTIFDHDLSLRMITNGWDFPRWLPSLLRRRERVGQVAFSLDGATAEVHDANRRTGSFDAVMDAAQLCLREGLPFAFRTTITRQNAHQLEALLELSARRGAQELAVIPMQPTPQDVAAERLLSPAQQIRLTAEVQQLKRPGGATIVLTAGHFTWDLMRPCVTMDQRSLFVTVNGDVSLCCQLAGYELAGSDRDLVGNLREMTLREACDRVALAVDQYKKIKQQRNCAGALGPLDYFPCWYCLKHFGKLGWMAGAAGNPWADDLRDSTWARGRSSR